MLTDDDIEKVISILASKEDFKEVRNAITEVKDIIITSSTINKNGIY